MPERPTPRTRLRKQALDLSGLSTREARQELGSTGLVHYGGRIYEEWLRELRGPLWRRVVREMRDNDPVIGAVLFAVEMLVRQVTWRVEPGGDSPADVEAAEFLESCMHDMSHSWESFVSEVLSVLPWGFSPHEIVYKQRRGFTRDPATRSFHTDNRIGWRKLPIRAQDTVYRWEIAEDGGVDALEQLTPQGHRATIPIQKLLLFRTTAHKGNPEGRSVLRNAYRPWFFKKRMEELEGIGTERDLAGLPVALVPPRIMQSGATAEEKATYEKIKEIVRNIRRDEQEGVVFPAARDDKGHLLYDLKLLSTGGQRQFDINQTIVRYDQRIAMTVLADFILLGHEKVGSFALSSDKTDLFAVALGAWLDEIKTVVNRHAVPRLFALNAFSLEKLPTIEYDDLERPDLGKLGEFISKIAGAGVPLFPDDKLENALRGAANLPPVPEDDGGVREEEEN